MSRTNWSQYDAVTAGRRIPDDGEVAVVFMPEHESHRWGFRISSGVWRYRTREDALRRKPEVLETLRTNVTYSKGNPTNRATSKASSARRE